LRKLNDKSYLYLGTGLFLGVLSLLVMVRSFPPLYRGTLPDGYQYIVDDGKAGSGPGKAKKFKDQYETFDKRLNRIY
jgi:hypothetical protein